MALKDFIASNIKGGVSDSLTTGVGGLFTGLGVLNIAKSNEKLKETFKLLKDMALFRLAWPVALLGMLRGVQGVIKGIVRDTGSLEAALRRMAGIQGLTRQFTEIMKSAQTARRHVAELYQFSSRSNFNVDQLAKASKSYQLLGENVYQPIEALQVFGDVASATSNNIEDVSSVVSTFFSEVKKGQDISLTVEEMRQMGIVSSDTAGSLDRMQKDGASATAMFSTMQGILSKMKGGMAGASGDITTAASNLDKAKDEMKAGFGAGFVESEVKSMMAMTTIIRALTPAITILAQHLADLATFANNITLRFAAWIASSSAASPILNSLANSVGLVLKGLTALSVVGIARTFTELTTGSSAATRGLQNLSQWAGNAIGSVNRLGSSIGSALGGSKLSSIGGDLHTRASAIQAGRPLNQMAFGPLTQAQAATAQMNTNLSMTRVRALGAAAGLRVMGFAAQGAALALRALAAATIWMLILQVIAVILQKVTDKIEDWETGMTGAERAAKAMRDETDQLTKSLSDQIGTIDTVADKLRALANINDDAASAQKNLQDLLNKGSAIGTATEGIIGNKQASPEEIAAAKDRITKIEQARKAANAATTAETDEQRTARQAQTRRDKIEREANYEARMQYYGTGGQLVTRNRKIGQLQKDVDQGRAALDERARMTEVENQSQIRIKELEGKKAKAQTMGLETSGYDSAIAAEKAKVTSQKQGSSSASVKASGNIEAIDAAIRAANLQAQGDTSSADYKESQRRAGGYFGQSKDELQRQKDIERNKRDTAKGVEDNYEGNISRLSQLKNDQVLQILNSSSPVLSTLGRIGLGGNTGESDLISIAKAHKDISARILEIMLKQTQVTEPEDDKELFGSY